MKTMDKFLVGIVGAIVVIVVIIFVVVLAQSNPEYEPENTPEGAVHNYLLALDKGDFERALTYISPCIKNAPKTPVGLEKLTEKRWGDFRDLHQDTSIKVQPLEPVKGRTVAIVHVNQTTYYSYGPFDNSVDQDDFRMTVKKYGDEWKLIRGENYWYDDWEHTKCVHD